MPIFDSFKYFWDGDWLDAIPQKLGCAAKPTTIEREPFAIPQRAERAHGNHKVPRRVRRHTTAVSTDEPAARKTSGKHSPSLAGSGPSLPREKVPTSKGKPVKLGTLRKKDGSAVMTGRAVNPDGVVAGRILKHFLRTHRSCHSQGFRSRGQSCWKNAALQGLLHVPIVYHFLGNIHRDCDQSIRRCVTCALQDLFQRYWRLGGGKGETKVISHADLDAAILKNIPKTPINDKGDLHDLVGWHNDVQDDAWLYIDKLLDLVLGAGDERDVACLKQVFEMKRKSTWTCVDCGEAHDSSSDSEDECGFSLTVPLNMPRGDREWMTFMDRLHENVFTDEGVQARCMSDACKAARKAVIMSGKNEEELPLQTKHYTITKAPEVLIVLQKRFAMSEGDDGLPKLKNGRAIVEKLKEETWYEEYLNLGRYTEDEEDLLYRLDAVVAHRGDRVSSGHYIATVREANGVDFAIINDSVVQGEQNSNVVKYPQSNGDQFEPYVMFYSKV